MAITAPASGTVATADPFAAFAPASPSSNIIDPNAPQFTAPTTDPTSIPSPTGPATNPANTPSFNGPTGPAPSAPSGFGVPSGFGQSAASGMGGGFGTQPFNMNPTDPASGMFRRIKPMQTGAGSAGMANAQPGGGTDVMSGLRSYEND